jgi:hypothetical protein
MVTDSWKRFPTWLWILPVYALASISVALYYNITFFGKALIVLPSFPVAGGCLFYYLSAFNTTPPVAQVVLWIVSFLFSGLVWCGLLGMVDRRLGPTRIVTQAWPKLFLLPLLYALPLPWLLWVHALSSEGLSLSALKAAVLVRDGLYWSSQGSEPLLNGLFALLALLETALTLVWLRRYAHGRFMLIFLISGTGLMVVLCAAASLAFLPV